MTINKEDFDKLFKKYDGKESDSIDNKVKNINILVVDDQFGPRKSLEKVLSHYYNVDLAASGFEALSKINDNHYCVVMDIAMKKLNGVNTANEIWKSYDVPIIFITGHPMEANLSEIRGNNLFGYFIKGSFTEDQLQIAVKQACDKKYIAEDRKKIIQLFSKSQKMEAIAEFSQGIAHNFNNLLMGIIGNASLAQLAKTPADMKKNIMAIQKLVHDGSVITSQLFNYSKSNEQMTSAYDLSEIIDDCASLYEKINPTITFVKNYNKDFFSSINRNEFEQIVNNLFINAGHAMPSGGNIYLSIDDYTKKIPFDTTDFNIITEYNKLSVRDEGCGIPEKNLKKIFDPFFTTKNDIGGTGLGLATVKTILKNYHGHVRVKSEIDKGTVFELYLPKTTEPVKKDKSSSLDLKMGNGEKILLIDDEARVYESLSQIIEKIGYHIEVEDKGLSGLKKYTENDYDMVLLDILMPGGASGMDIYKSLKSYDDKCKVLFITGTDFFESSTEHMKKDYSVLKKPFNAIDLSNKIYEVLHEQS